MKYITFAQAAERLHKSKATIYRYMKQGVLTPYYRGAGRQYAMFDVSEVEALLEYQPAHPRKPLKPKDVARLRDGYRCAVCYATVSLNVHHIVTLANGGPDTPENLITLCSRCHFHIHNRTDINLLMLRTRGEEQGTMSIVEWLLRAVEWRI